MREKRSADRFAIRLDGMSRKVFAGGSFFADCPQMGVAGAKAQRKLAFSFVGFLREFDMRKFFAFALLALALTGVATTIVALDPRPALAGSDGGGGRD